MMTMMSEKSPMNVTKCVTSLAIIMSVSFILLMTSVYRISLFPQPLPPAAVHPTRAAVKSLKVFESISDDMPSITGTNITAEEIRQNLKRCRLASIRVKRDCAKVHNNPVSFWRSTKLSGFSHKIDASNINLATECCAFDHPELIAPSPSDEMFPWERDYLSQGPLTNMADTAWASKSNLKLSKKSVKKIYYVGDDVSFIISIYNGHGEKRGRGGDSIRLWLVNYDLGASVTANVKDKGDGTYEAKVKLPWVGKVSVKATIAHTRELFRSVLYIQRLFTTTRWLSGVYKNSIASETTPCSPLPFLPGFPLPRVCNVTKENGHIPWYCGKPVKKQLNCSDYIGTLKTRWPSAVPLNRQDEELIKLTESKRPFLIPTKIELTVRAKPTSKWTTIPTPTTPCRRRDLSTTFSDSMSTGYFYNMTWRPFSCALPKINQTFANDCLKQTTFILIGDSNTRAQIDKLADLTKCTHKIKKTKVKWHAPLRCDNDKIRMSIQLYPHKQPFFGSWGEVMTETMLTSTVDKLDSIPSTGRFIILIHHFLHVIPFHLSMTRTRMNRNREAIARLLERNPTTYVIIQSPHSAYDHSKFNKHKMNIFLFEMTKSILSGLGERVMFLNTFDLTIANENKDGHPPISNEFMNLYLGHLCGR